MRKKKSILFGNLMLVFALNDVVSETLGNRSLGGSLLIF